MKSIGLCSQGHYNTRSVSTVSTTPSFLGRSFLLLMSIRPCVIFTLLINMALVTAFPRFERLLSTALVQMNQQMSALVSKRKRDLGSCQRLQVLFSFGFCRRIISPSHCFVSEINIFLYSIITLCSTLIMIQTSKVNLRTK